ncbi:MAG: DUF885 domain-containing protein [Actinomycetota bacterium]
MPSGFDHLIDDYLQDLCEEAPTSASALGFDGFDDQLGDLSQQGFERRNESRERWAKQFSDRPEADLTFEESTDKALVMSTLHGGRLSEQWQGEKRDPTVYLGPGLQGVFSLFQHRLRPIEELVTSAASRMRQVPEMLEDGKKNLDPALASKLSIDRGLKQCASAIGFFSKPEVDDPALAEAGEQAADACRDFASFLEDLAKSASGEWAIGEDLYSRLLTEKEQLSYGAAEMLERGKASYAELDKEITAFSKQHFDNEDWVEALKVLRETEHAESPEHLRQQYEYWSEEARRFLKERDLVTMPEGEVCHVVPAPGFQRAVLSVASYSAPPPMKGSKVGHFFVPYPVDGTSAEEVDKRMKGSGLAGIATTSVHEAYPGHHWHLVKMQDSPRKIRKVLRTAYFTEGWALYAERMMREQDFYPTPAQVLAHLGARIFRAARIVVDTSLHMKIMTFEDAVRFIMEKGLIESTATAEVTRYCAWPTQASSYFTGAVEIERMRDEYFSRGQGDLKSFHDTMATMGGLPLGLAERVLKEG